MLRFALFVLLIANAGYLAWSQGWMATLGWEPAAQSEPYRLQQQVRPEVLSIVSPQATTQPAAGTVAAPSAVVASSDPVEEILPEVTTCLQSESMDEAQSHKLQAALRSSDLPTHSWEMIATPIAGRWMVYLGKFANETALEKRRAELRNRKIAYDRAGGNLEPGLSLGRFSTEEAATRELGNMLSQGVRGARVVQERAPQTVYALRLSQATVAQRNLLHSMAGVLGGKTLQPCPSK